MKLPDCGFEPSYNLTTTHSSPTAIVFLHRTQTLEQFSSREMLTVMSRVGHRRVMLKVSILMVRDGGCVGCGSIPCPSGCAIWGKKTNQNGPICCVGKFFTHFSFKK